MSCGVTQILAGSGVDFCRSFLLDHLHVGPEWLEVRLTLSQILITVAEVAHALMPEVLATDKQQ